MINRKNKREDTATKEDVITKAIEQQTKKIPSDTFLATALATMALSFTLKCFGRHKDAAFVGHWAAPFSSWVFIIN